MVPTKIFPDEQSSQSSERSVLAKIVDRVFPPRASRPFEPSSPEDRLRQQLLHDFWRCIARIEDIAARACELVAQRNRMQGDLQGLDQGFPDFTVHQGRRLGFALLSLVCVPFSAGIDWGLISTPVEALLTILGLPSGWLSRILAALQPASCRTARIGQNGPRPVVSHSVGCSRLPGALAQA